MLFSKNPFRRRIRRGHRYSLKELFERRQKPNDNSDKNRDANTTVEGFPKISADRTNIGIDDFARR